MKSSYYHFQADVIRLLAGIGVVTIHTTSPFVYYPHFFSTLPFWIANILDSAARVSVPLFVMISGFLLLDARKDYSLKQFIKKRIARIGIPILIWPIVYLLWDIFFFHLPFPIDKLFSSFITMNIYYHLYFLYLIFGLYLITPVLKEFTIHAQIANKNFFLYLSLLFPVALFAINTFFVSGVYMFSTIFTIFIPYIGYFIAGDYFKNTRLSTKSTKIYLAIFILLVVITAGCNFLYMRSVGWNNTLTKDPDTGKYFYNYFSISVLPMSLLAFILLINNQTLGKIANEKIITLIKQFSAATFGVYLIHPMILDVLDTVSLFNLKTISSPVWLFLFIKLFTMIIVSFLLVFFFRKLPLIKLIFG